MDETQTKFRFWLGDKVITDDPPEGYKKVTGEDFETTLEYMACRPEVKLYVRMLPTVKLRIRIWSFMYGSNVKHQPKLLTWNFKLFGKNHVWIYWIKIYG